VIVLCRHGETATNREGRLLGRADPPLTLVGRSQAARLAGRLARERPAVVVCSPARRARETGEVIASAAGVEVTVEPRLVELDYGEWDGLAVGDPQIPWARWREEPDLCPPGGESLVALRVRVTAACRDLLGSHGPDAVVVVVSHVSPIKAAVVWALGVDDSAAWHMHLDLASITRLGTGRDGRPSLWAFNDVAHLATP
jgi:broad specificity phosphatase PhoE